MASSTKFRDTTNVEEENLFSEDMQDTPMGAEWDKDNEEVYNVEEEEARPSNELCTKFLDELELRELSILWQRWI